MTPEEESEWINKFHPSQRGEVVRWLRAKREREQFAKDVANEVIRRLESER